MAALSTAALLAAWEDGMGEPAVDRAPTLLRSLGFLGPASDPSAMTVGSCDLLLFELRGELFGPDLDLVVTCPVCGAVIELVIPIADVLPSKPAAGQARVIVDDDGLRIRCRLPTNGDLTELAAIGPDATVVDLLARCVEAIEGPDTAPGVAELPLAAAERVAGVLAASDPGSEVTVEIECPCGTAWPETVDIRAIVWTELTRWVHERLGEVHQLAVTYGWAERDILDMSPFRRRLYLEYGRL
jgi:hypothetical protein